MKQINQLGRMAAVAAVALCTAITSFSQTGPLTMKQAIDIALQNNLSLKADSMNLSVTDHQNRIVRADLLPQVNYSGKAEVNLALPAQMIPGQFVGQPSKDLVAVQMGTRYTTGGGVEVSQTLFNKSTRIKVSGAGLNNQIAASRHQLTKEEIVYQVATAYYSLQASAERIRTTQHDYDNLREILAVSKAQFENGVLKKIDYQSLQITTANKEASLNQLQTEYNEQLTNFNYLLGIPADTRTVISDTIRRLNEWVEAGDLLQQRQDIQLAGQLIQSKQLEMNSIRAEAKPVISSYFRFNYQSQFNDAAKVFDNDYWFKSSAMGITASLTIFDGHRRRSRYQVAAAQLKQLQFQSDQTRQQAGAEWLVANESLRRDQHQYTTTLNNLGLAEKVFASRRALYTEGVTTLTELLDAESDLSESRNLHIQALIGVQTSLVNTYKAKGTLLTEFLNTL